jgi:hypothetical protein
LSPLDLAQKAADAASKGLRTQLVIPRRAGGSSRVKVLGGSKGVKVLWGELCCENADGKAVVWVDSIDLLAWLAAYAGVKVEVKP